VRHGLVAASWSAHRAAPANGQSAATFWLGYGTFGLPDLPAATSVATCRSPAPCRLS